MAGALATAAGYDDEDEDGYGYSPDVGNEYATEQPSGPLTRAQYQPGSDAEEDWWKRATSGLGAPEEIGGALSQQQGKYDAKKERQIQVIRAARDRVPSAGRGNVDLPMLFAAAALGSPTRTGSTAEGLSGAFRAAGNQIDRERERDIQRTEEYNRLDLLGAQTDVAGAQADYGFAKDRFNLGREAVAAAARNKAYRESIEQRRQAAVAKAKADADADKQKAQDRADTLAQRQLEHEDAAQYSSWIGNDKDTGLPIFANRFGQTRLGEKPIAPKPSGAGAGSDTALVKNARFYVQNGIAADIPTAVTMLRESVGSAATFQRLVQAEKNLLIKNGKVDPATNAYIGPYTDAEAEKAARENVRARVETAKSFNAPLAGPDTSAIFKQGAAAPPPTPAQNTPATAPPPPAPPQAQREPGKVYQTPKGPLTWTGTGWRQ